MQSDGEEIIRQISPRATLLGHEKWSLRCAISANGLVAVSGDGKPSARLWNLDRPYTSKEFGEDRLGIRQCCLSDDGAVVAVAGVHKGNSVALYDSTTGGDLMYEIKSPTHGLTAAGCALTPDAKALAATFRSSNRSNGSLKVVRWRKDYSEEAQLDRPFSIWQCQMSADARRVAFKFWHGTSAGIEVVDPWTDMTHFRLSMPTSEWSFAMDAAATIVVTASEWALRVCSLHDESNVRSLSGYTFSDYAHCSVSSDGEYVVAPIRDYKFGVWHVQSSSLMYILSGHSDRTNGCAVSSDGSRVITCSNDRTIRIWDIPKEGATKSQDSPLKNTMLENMRTFFDESKPSKLGEPYLSELLIPDCVCSMQDLLYAHTIILIVKRSSEASGTGTTSAEKFAHTIYSSLFGRLHTQMDVFISQVLMLHAEREKLLPRKFSSQLGPFLKPTKSMINSLREFILEAWGKVFSLPKDGNQNELELTLESCLDNMYQEIRNMLSHNKTLIFLSIAMCTLFYHPAVIGDQRQAMRELPKKIRLLDIIPRSTKSLQISNSAELTAVEAILPIDICSPLLLKRLFLLESIAKLPNEARKKVLTAITKSKFKSIEEIDSYLDEIGSKTLRSRYQDQSEINAEDSSDISQLFSTPHLQSVSIFNSDKSRRIDDISETNTLFEMTGEWDSFDFDSRMETASMQSPTDKGEIVNFSSLQSNEIENDFVLNVRPRKRSQEVEPEEGILCYNIPSKVFTENGELINFQGIQNERKAMNVESGSGKMMIEAELKDEQKIVTTTKYQTPIAELDQEKKILREPNVSSITSVPNDEGKNNNNTEDLKKSAYESTGTSQHKYNDSLQKSPIITNDSVKYNDQSPSLNERDQSSVETDNVSIDEVPKAQNEEQKAKNTQENEIPHTIEVRSNETTEISHGVTSIKDRNLSVTEQEYGKNDDHINHRAAIFEGSSGIQEKGNITDSRIVLENENSRRFKDDNGLSEISLQAHYGSEMSLEIDTNKQTEATDMLTTSRVASEKIDIQEDNIISEVVENYAPDEESLRNKSSDKEERNRSDLKNEKIENKAEKKEKTPSRRTNLKKNILNFAKGARNSFVLKR